MGQQKDASLVNEEFTLQICFLQCCTLSVPYLSLNGFQKEYLGRNKQPKRTKKYL